jgi:hypothetical protein
VSYTPPSGSGGAPATATYVTTAAEAGLSAEAMLSDLFGRGTLAARPAAGVAGRHYFVTDTNTMTRDTGTIWENVEGTGTATTYAQTKTVAKSGGDHLTIQAAIDAISGASSTTRYLVLVHPGLYAEQVTMKSWVDVRGIDRASVQIEHAATAGAVIMADNCEISNLTIENSATEGHWGIVATEKSGVHIRHVSLLAPFGSGRRGAGIKVTGTAWATLLIEDVLINTYTQTNQGVFIQSDGVDLVDATLKSVFVDALDSTTGGAILIDGAEDAHLRDVYSRVSSVGYGLRVIGGSVVDVTSCYFEAGTHSIEIDASTVYLTGTPITNSVVSGGGAMVGPGRGVMVTRVTNQSAATGTDTAISWTAAEAEHVNRFGDWWNLGTNPTRITVPYHGWYSITASLLWASNATGDRFLHLKKNGSTWLANSSNAAIATAITQTQMAIAATAYLSAGDYVEIIGMQTSGGSINIESAKATVAHWY